MDRKRFLQQGVLAGAGIISLPQVSFGNTSYKAADPLPKEKVKEFVSAGHNNLDKVKVLLLEFPTLIYASWDLGGGDFETGLEGAGHVGDKAIANYLIGVGSRTNLFVLTMLGKTALVKAFLNSYPQYLTARGPHGLTLLHHAQRGGEDANELFEYLQMKGLKDMKTAL